MTRCRHGFTLLEILLVMLIMGIFAGAMTINMRAGYNSLALDRDSRLLADVIRAGQRFAEARQLPCRLEIDPSRQEYCLTYLAAADGRFELLPDELGGMRQLSQNVFFARVRKTAPGATDDRLIHFHPHGVAEAAYITLEAATGEVRTIRIDPLFGAPTIEGAPR